LQSGFLACTFASINLMANGRGGQMNIQQYADQKSFLVSGDKPSIDMVDSVFDYIPREELIKVVHNYVTSNKDWQDKSVSLLFNKLYKEPQKQNENEYVDIIKDSFPYVLNVRKWAQGKSTKFNEMELLKMNRQIVETGIPVDKKELLVDLLAVIKESTVWKMTENSIETYKNGKDEFGLDNIYYKLQIEHI
jgi:hypothetical protein